LVLQVVPYVSADDARNALPTLWSRRHSFPTEKITLREERMVAAEGLQELSEAHLVEERTEGFASAARIVMARMESVVLSVVCVTRRQQDWSWQEVKALASLQGKKVKKVLDSA
jgi:hypothetical protein